MRMVLPQTGVQERCRNLPQRAMLVPWTEPGTLAGLTQRVECLALNQEAGVRVLQPVR